MHPFLLEQPALPASAPAKHENKMSVSEDGTSAAACTTAAAAAEKAANANSLNIAALALTPRSEAAAAAAARAAASAHLSPAATAANAAANAAPLSPPPPPPPPPLPPPPPPHKIRLRIEARLRASHPASASPSLRRDLERQLSLLLRDRSWVYRDCAAVSLPGAPPQLLAALETCAVVDTAVERACPPGTVLLFWQVELRVACYSVSSEPPAVPPSLEDEGGQGGPGEGAGAPPYRETVLPHASLEGALEALALPPGHKSRVLRRLGAALALGGAGVDPRLVPSGRLALLLGPPGTGKTSLCRAAAQRLAVRLCFSGDNGGGGSAPASNSTSSRFPGGALLLEVSAPALFSKWFSESGRAVARLFERVASLASDEQALVFVLIDEVESLAGSRVSSSSSSASSGGDPGDAMRAVNALLTGLDALRDSAPGTCVFCTSNLGGMLDAAFVDRADVVLHLGPPPASARYSMLAASIAELSRARVVRGVEVASSSPPSPSPSSSASALLPLSLREEDFSPPSSSRRLLLPPLAARLAEISLATEGLSGRALRRLPFAALSDAIGLYGLEEASSSFSSSSSAAAAAASSSASSAASAAASDDSSAGIDALVFMEALAAAAEGERSSHGDL